MWAVSAATTADLLAQAQPLTKNYEANSQKAAILMTKAATLIVELSAMVESLGSFLKVITR